MNNNSGLNVAIGLLSEPSSANLFSKFIMKLNTTDRANFTNNATNKNAFIRRWIREKTGYSNSEIQALVNLRKPANTRNAFERYVNALENAKNANMTIVRHMAPREPPPYVNLQMKKGKGPVKGYIQLEPLCKNNYSRGVYIHYGETRPKYRGPAHKNARGKGIGYRLREVARNAALKSKTLLYQVSQNIEGLVAPGDLPISGKIMQSLGAHPLSYPPPCRSENVRGPQNHVFLVGPKPPKRPIIRETEKRKRTLTARRN